MSDPVRHRVDRNNLESGHRLRPDATRCDNGYASALAKRLKAMQGHDAKERVAAEIALSLTTTRHRRGSMKRVTGIGGIFFNAKDALLGERSPGTDAKRWLSYPPGGPDGPRTVHCASPPGMNRATAGRAQIQEMPRRQLLGDR